MPEKMGFEIALGRATDQLAPEDDGLDQPTADTLDSTWDPIPAHEKSDRRPYPCKVRNYTDKAGRCALALAGAPGDITEMCAKRCLLDAVQDPTRTPREEAKLRLLEELERSRDTQDEVTLVMQTVIDAAIERSEDG